MFFIDIKFIKIIRFYVLIKLKIFLENNFKMMIQVRIKYIYEEYSDKTMGETGMRSVTTSV